MKMKTLLASLFMILASTGPLLSASELDRLRTLCAEQEMQIKQLELRISHLTESTSPSSEAATDTTESHPVAEIRESIYVVKSGDSIERIARNNDTTPAALAKLNGLNPNSMIHPGQKLKVTGTTAADAKASKPNSSTKPRTHTVKSEETFYKISQQYGVSVDQLLAANPRVDHNALRVGQILKISSSTTPSAAKTPDLESTSSLASNPSVPVSNKQIPAAPPRASDKPVKIVKEISYGDFAKDHNTSTRRLDELNGLELDPSTVLAQGSELYIPAQP
ncbi:MAG: LysM peptidoglycan-binding domain-containing protein [Armatimonadetes bacterium]|nr:LysM peptidoglycan-binding domain-containing protein [Akkermansiaceae bacterium]